MKQEGQNRILPLFARGSFIRFPFLPIPPAQWSTAHLPHSPGVNSLSARAFWTSSGRAYSASNFALRTNLAAGTGLSAPLSGQSSVKSRIRIAQGQAHEFLPSMEVDSLSILSSGQNVFKPCRFLLVSYFHQYLQLGFPGFQPGTEGTLKQFSKPWRRRSFSLARKGNFTGHQGRRNDKY